MTAYRMSKAGVPSAGAGLRASVGRAEDGALARVAIAIGRWRGTVVVTVRGELDASGSERLAAVLHDLVDGQGNLDVALDLGGVRRLDRCGVDVLATAAGRSARRGGLLRVGRASGAVLDALTTAGLGQLLSVPQG